MLTFFIILSVVLAAFLVTALVLLKKEMDRREFWHHRYIDAEMRGDSWYEKWQHEVEDNVKLQSEYDALDQGTNEIEENYQQELLDEFDKVNALRNSNAYWERIASELELIRLDHESSCLPNLNGDILVTDELETTPIYASVVFDRIG